MNYSSAASRLKIIIMIRIIMFILPFYCIKTSITRQYSVDSRRQSNSWSPPQRSHSHTHTHSVAAQIRLDLHIDHLSGPASVTLNGATFSPLPVVISATRILSFSGSITYDVIAAAARPRGLHHVLISPWLSILFFFFPQAYGISSLFAVTV